MADTALQRVPQAQSLELVEEGRQVWDAESHQHVTVTGEMLARFSDSYNKIFYGQLMTADGLTDIYRDHTYPAANCKTFGEFVEKHTPFGLRWARRLVRMGEAKWLLLSAVQNLGLSEEKIGELSEAMHKQKRPLQLALLQLPADEVADKIKETYIAPDGRELSSEEVLKIVGKDAHDKLKGTQAALSTEKERSKTLEAELDAMRKRMNGDTTVAQQFAGRIEELQQEIEQIRGRRERGEAAAAMIAKAEKCWEEGFAYVRPYMPDKLSDLDEMPEEIELAIGLVSRIRTRLDNLFQQWILLDMQRSQPGG